MRTAIDAATQIIHVGATQRAASKHVDTAAGQEKEIQVFQFGVVLQAQRQREDAKLAARRSRHAL